MNLMPGDACPKAILLTSGSMAIKLEGNSLINQFSKNQISLHVVMAVMPCQAGKAPDKAPGRRGASGNALGGSHCADSCPSRGFILGILPTPTSDLSKRPPSWDLRSCSSQQVPCSVFPVFFMVYFSLQKSQPPLGPLPKANSGVPIRSGAPVGNSFKPSLPSSSSSSGPQLPGSRSPRNATKSGAWSSSLSQLSGSPQFLRLKGKVSCSDLPASLSLRLCSPWAIAPQSHFRLPPSPPPLLGTPPQPHPSLNSPSFFDPLPQLPPLHPRRRGQCIADTLEAWSVAPARNALSIQGYRGPGQGVLILTVRQMSTLILMDLTLPVLPPCFPLSPPASAALLSVSSLRHGKGRGW